MSLENTTSTFAGISIDCSGGSWAWSDRVDTFVKMNTCVAPPARHVVPRTQSNQRCIETRRACIAADSQPRQGPVTLAHGAMVVYFLYHMEFEFDPLKSASNLRTHGIDFVAAQSLWQDPDRLEIPARFTDEPRVQVIGRIGKRVWSAFTTVREGRVRIISVRRARDEEEEAYRQN